MTFEKGQRNFTAGEISPKLYTAVELQKYNTGLRKCRNMFVHVQGGVSNRAGFEYLNAVKDSTKKYRLIPFQFSTTQNYILEFCDNEMRVFRNQGLVLEASKSISGATQANPCVITTSSAHGFSSGDWVYISGVTGMTELNGKFFKVTVLTTTTFSIANVFSANVNSSSYGSYSSGGVCEKIYDISTPYGEDDLREIRYTQSADVMTFTHRSYAPRDLTRTDHNAWNLTSITFSPEVSAPTDIRLSRNTSGSTTYKYRVTAIKDGEESLIGSYRTSSISGVTQANPAVVTSSGHGFSNGELVSVSGVVGMTELNGNQYEVANATTNTFELSGIDSTAYTAYTSGGSCVSVGINSDVLTNTKYVDISWDAVAGADRYNVYKYDNGQYGYLGTVVEGDLTFRDDNISPDLSDTPPQERNPFDGDNYPQAVTYHKQRKVFGGSDDNPQTLYGTQVGHYKNMNVSVPAKDDDAYTFVLDSEQVQRISHLTSLKKLIAFTTGSTWLIKGGGDSENITPSSVDADEEFVAGCSSVRPLRIGRDVLYVEDGGQRVLFLNYSFEADGLDGEDLTLLSEHLFEGKEIVEWAYCDRPYKIIWCVMDDGSLNALTYLRKQQVWAWHRHDTDGKVESVAAIREGDEDYLYAVIERTIDGVDRKGVERMRSRRFGKLMEDAFFVDAGGSVDQWNSNASSKVTLSGGTTYKTNETLTITENGTLSPFSASDVGKTIALRIKDKDGKVTSRCSFKVTAYTNSTTISCKANVIVPSELRGATTENYSFQITTISNLFHLEGKTVSVLGDGNVQAQKVVSDGVLSLENPASKVQYGLPYNSDVETLDADLVQGQGENLNALKTMSRLNVYVHDTRSLMAGRSVDDLEEWNNITETDNLQPPEELTGRAVIGIDGSWDDKGSVYIRNSDPLPCTILGITPEYEIGND